MTVINYLLCVSLTISLGLAERKCWEDDDANDLLPLLDYCRKEHLDFERCWKATLEDLRPYVKDGSRYYSIRSVEKIPIDEEFQQRVSLMTINMSDFDMYGLSDYIVGDIDIDNIRKMVFELKIPKLRLKGDYSMNGRLMQFPVIPVRGHGPITINMTDCSVKAILYGKTYMKNGDRKIKFMDADIRMKVDGGKIMIEDIKNGDKNYQGPVNYMLNDHFRDIVVQLVPSVKEAVRDLLLDISNAIAKPFTLKELFSDSVIDSSEEDDDDYRINRYRDDINRSNRKKNKSRHN